MTERLEAGEITVYEATELTREAVLNSLTASAKSRHELAQSLARRGFPESAALTVLDRFEEVGLIDDAGYADTLVRTRHAERGLARRAIGQELRRRGIDDEVAAEALAQVDDADEQESAARLAEKLIARSCGQAREARIRKAASALARKGYSPGLAFAAVKNALSAEGEETNDLDIADG
ncbi:MAG: RecX family transcriptional regulator [Promicromonosporaceae bacterium]|nr:RecX family transcriptional regulator [Promicromonosporaceae bacterium]